MKLIKTLLVAILFIIAITFALQNQQPVTLHYYGLIPPFSVPLFLLAFVAILIGILITGFGDIFVRYTLRMRARSCEKGLKKCRKELDALKKIREKEASLPGKAEEGALQRQPAGEVAAPTSQSPSIEENA